MTQGIDDSWALGEAYDAYMGRWSRLVAREFLHWLAADPECHWLEVGCGTGALTSTICHLAQPSSVIASDQSASFVAHAHRHVVDPRVSHVAAAADALPRRTGGFDVIVSGLVLNFIPDPSAALTAMRERVRPGGSVAAYVWDYAGGIEFLRHFWEEAVSLDPRASAVDESRRFGAWQLTHLTSLFDAAGLLDVRGGWLTVPTTFANFEDYWRPFLGATGPAPSYVASLSPPDRERLAQRLKARLPSARDGSIRLEARALAVHGVRGT